MSLQKLVEKLKRVVFSTNHSNCGLIDLGSNLHTTQIQTSHSVEYLAVAFSFAFTMTILEAVPLRDG
jgi:hypothetical protein